MERLTDLSCTQFAEVLASKAPVPGGGGASALVSALGIALCTMVGNYTVGKKKYAEYEEEVKTIMAEATEIQEKLIGLVNKDAEAFEPLSKAYAIPKEDPTHDEVMEGCLRNAVAAPVEMVKLSCRAIELHKRMGEIGSVLVLSDVGTGVVFCWSVLYGAALNVKVNTKSMKDRAYADALNKEVDELVAKYWVMAEEVYKKVAQRFE